MIVINPEALKQTWPKKPRLDDAAPEFEEPCDEPGDVLLVVGGFR
jgi:hypothetical protein